MDLNSGENGEQKSWRKYDRQMYFITFFVIYFFPEVDNVMSFT